MDVNSLRTGEKIAGASGVALLLIMFIFGWFSYGEGAFSASGNAWETMELIRFVILLAAAAGIGLAVVSATQSQVNLPVALSALAAGLGILATVLIIFRLISPPDFGIGDLPGGDDFDVGRDIGVFLGLIAAAGVAYGGWTAMQEEGTSFGDQADRLQGPGDGPGAAPPPPPPPAPPAPPASGGPAA